MKNLDEVARIWASRRLKFPLERIGEVSFEATEGYYYSEYTNENAYCAVIIEVTGYSRQPKTRYKDLRILDEFSTVLEELVAIAQEEL